MSDMKYENEFDLRQLLLPDDDSFDVEAAMKEVREDMANGWLEKMEQDYYTTEKMDEDIMNGYMPLMSPEYIKQYMERKKQLQKEGRI